MHSDLVGEGRAYAIETQKVELPHRYLQNRFNRGDILAALNAKVSWKRLGKYIDWFGDKSADDLQFRREGRTHAEWVEEQPMRIWWHDHKHEKIHFRSKMSEYLTADVDALWELTEKVGNAMAERGCDIRKQCTLGSRDENLEKFCYRGYSKTARITRQNLAKTNGGGFRGPLG